MHPRCDTQYFSRVGDACFHWCRGLYVSELFTLIKRGDSMTVVTAAVMILRVWAMYNRSRIILGVLLSLYALEIVSFIITCVIISTKLPGM